MQIALPEGQESGEVWWKKELVVEVLAVGWAWHVAPQSGINCPVSGGLVHTQACTGTPITRVSDIDTIKNQSITPHQNFNLKVRGAMLKLQEVTIINLLLRTLKV